MKLLLFTCQRIVLSYIYFWQSLTGLLWFFSYSEKHVITDAHKTPYCSPIGRKTAPETQKIEVILNN